MFNKIFFYREQFFIIFLVETIVKSSRNSIDVFMDKTKAS
jgi:hypothetical protein